MCEACVFLKYERVHAAIAKRQEEEDYRRWKDTFRFDLALLAYLIYQALEDQRDRYAPSRLDDEWDPRFCEAISLIPQAKAFAMDCWYGCVEVKT